MDHAQTAAVALAALLVGSALGAGATTLLAPPTADLPDAPLDAGIDGNATGVATFANASEFAAYVQRGRAAATGAPTPLFGPAPRERVAFAGDAATDAPQATAAPEATRSADAETVSLDTEQSDDTRFSTTNVREQGIDEPDLVKTDGETAFYSPQGPRYVEPARPERDRPSGTTHVLSVDSPAAPEQIGTVDQGGRMLLVGDTLVVLGAQSLTGYDVTDPDKPEEVWSKPIEGAVEAARLVDGRLYLVTSTDVAATEPCPLTPLGAGAPVPCTAVYHPRQPVNVDVTYTTHAIAPDTGDVLDSVGFVGTAGRSVVYAAGDALYVTYTQQADTSKALIDVVLASQGDRMDAATVRRLRELRTYNLSAAARQTELRVIIQEWLSGLSEDERATVRQQLSNAWTDYAEANKRAFTTTGVVEVSYADADGSPDLSVTATGTVPGVPLNQFSLDAHEGRLRIATTVEAPGVESENDLYVLDEDLERTGSVTGMGLNERIYSVRYVGDTAYVVTFRRIDPFHVVDLSNPSDPVVRGELKLPGFSSYLHPLPGDRVLGIGEEDGQVKAVVFDVSDPTDPVVADDYRLEDRWSAISQSHHAFLLDQRHGVFFLPGSSGGYVFGYEDGLTLETAISTDAPATRAIYVGDYMYVFAGSEVVVMDEETWERTTTVELTE